MRSKKKVGSGLSSVNEDGLIIRAGEEEEHEPEEIEEPTEPTPEYKDLDLADKIKELWVDKDKSAVEVCTTLKIQLGLFNRIIMKYSISKKRSVEDENFSG